MLSRFVAPSTHFSLSYFWLPQSVALFFIHARFSSLSAHLSIRPSPYSLPQNPPSYLILTGPSAYKTHIGTIVCILEIPLCMADGGGSAKDPDPAADPPDSAVEPPLPPPEVDPDDHGPPADIGARPLRSHTLTVPSVHPVARRHGVLLFQSTDIVCFVAFAFVSGESFEFFGSECCW